MDQRNPQTVLGTFLILSSKPGDAALRGGLLCVLSALAAFGQAPSVTIDVPTPGSSVFGTILVGGWAIDNTSVVGTAINNVQVKVDGNFVGYAIYGGAANRPDVCNVYPGRPGCPYVGFKYNLNMTGLSLGSHIHHRLCHR